MLILDTDILIDLQRGYPPVSTWLNSLDEQPMVPGLALMELVQDAENAQQVRRALTLARPFAVVWPTESDCQRAMSDFVAYHLSHGLGLLDALIAACAVGRSATLCTFNVRHYRIVPELATAQPYER